MQGAAWGTSRSHWPALPCPRQRIESRIQACYIDSSEVTRTTVEPGSINANGQDKNLGGPDDTHGVEEERFDQLCTRVVKINE